MRLLHVTTNKIWFVLLFALIFAGCEIPYEPEDAPDPFADQSSQSTTTGNFKVFEINTNKQICNPSISQDPVNYPGCMLWLGFSGVMNVDTSGVTGYKLPAREHDRLTITDTANKVQWYLKNTELGLSKNAELQDPEWSTHRDYIAFLAHRATKYDGMVVRIGDKTSLALTKNSLSVEATPHIYVADTTVSTGEVTNPEYYTNGFIKKSYIKTFFGTDQVKFVYNKAINGKTIYCIDYTMENPEPFQLNKPESKKDWNCESPLISEDGNWVVYNCISQGKFVPHFQKLSSTSTPHKVADNGYAPHWWTNPHTGDHYIVYSIIEGDYFITADLTSPNALEGGEGSTVKVRLTGSFGDVPAHMGPSITNDVTEICPLPMKGGMSHDGKFLCTGYSKAYIMYLF